MTRSRHIVFLNEFYHPDICATAAVLADRLPRIRRLLPNDRLTVIAGNRAWDDPSRIYPAEEEHEGVRIIRVERPAVGGRGLLRRGMGFLSYGINAARAARSLDPIDLVIGTTAPPHGGGIARRIARAALCPHIYTVWDLYPDLAASLEKLSESSLAFRIWRLRDLRWMRDSARVVCIAEGIRKRIIATRGMDPEKVVTIHDGFDPARLAMPSDPAANSFRREFNPSARFVVQYAGNMGLSHPFETIMQACARLGDDESLQFQFIGGGPQRNFVREHLPPNGVLIDYQPADRLGEVLAAADVCLISQAESMFDKALPYKVYATLAASKPMIFVGSEQSEIVGWLREQNCGISVRHGDSVGLAAAIRRLREDAALRATMGASGRRFLDRTLHSEASAQKWAGLVEDVLSANARSQ